MENNYRKFDLGNDQCFLESWALLLKLILKKSLKGDWKLWWFIAIDFYCFRTIWSQIKIESVIYRNKSYFFQNKQILKAHLPFWANIPLTARIDFLILIFKASYDDDIFRSISLPYLCFLTLHSSRHLLYPAGLRSVQLEPLMKSTRWLPLLNLG